MRPVAGAAGAAISRWRAGRGAGRARPRRCSRAPLTSRRCARLVPAARPRAAVVPGLHMRRRVKAGAAGGCSRFARPRGRRWARRRAGGPPAAGLPPGSGTGGRPRVPVWVSAHAVCRTAGEVRRSKPGEYCLRPGLGASIRLTCFAGMGEYGFGNLIFSLFSS